MARRILGWILILGSLCPAPAAGQVMAIWVWEAESFRMLDDPAWSREVLSKLAGDGFNTLYLYADSWEERIPIAAEPGRYATVIESAHARGFRVEALLGSAYLQTNRYVLPEKRDAARAMIRRVIAYNADASPSARFDAIHLDIEPYTLDEWDRDRMTVARMFVEAAREWRELANGGGSDLMIGAAIPFWFDRVELPGQSLAAALLEIFDYVALMDYRDEAQGRDGIIRHARDEIGLASILDRKVIIGIETDEADLDKLTFRQEGKRAMHGELMEVRGAFSDARAFWGIAVHHLRSYLILGE